jgi:3-phenylpropionate/cinnamic acid dioxygenase small subunit
MTEPCLACAGQRFISTYADCLDRGDFEGLTALADRSIRYDGPGGPLTGVEAWLRLMRANVAHPVSRSIHLVSNVLVDQVAATALRLVASFSAVLVRPDGTRLVFGRYEDDLQIDDGLLRLTRQRVEVAHSAFVPVIASY